VQVQQNDIGLKIIRHSCVTYFPSVPEFAEVKNFLLLKKIAAE